MEELDKKLLSILLSNSRAPISQIAKDLSTSRQRVAKRISGLYAEGVIRRFTISINWDRLHRFHVVVSMSSNPSVDMDEAISTLRGDEHVTTIYRLVGKPDTLIHLAIPKNLALLQKKIEELSELFRPVSMDVGIVTWAEELGGEKTGKKLG